MLAVGQKDFRRRRHHLGDRQIAQPADVLSASDRFAAQVKPPGGERVAERRAHRERRCDRGRERAARDGEIAGALEHEKRHRQRSADDRGAERPHADEHAGGGVEPEPGKERIDFDREKLAEQRPDEKRGEEQPAAEAGGERDHAREKLQRNEKGEFRRGQGPVEIEPERAVARAQHLRRIERHRAEHEAADDRPQDARGDGGAEPAFDEPRCAHRGHAERRRDEAEPDQGAVVDEGEGRRLQER